MSRAPAFRGIPVNAEEQFRLRLLGLIGEILALERHAGSEQEFLAQFGFLRSYADRITQLWQAAPPPEPEDWTNALARWQDRAVLPLDRSDALVTGSAVLPALLMIAAVEEDPRLSLLVEPAGGTPTLGGLTVFLADILPEETTGSIRRQLFELADIGLLTIGNTDAPRIEWSFRLSASAFDMLTSGQVRAPLMRLVPAPALPAPEDWIAPSPEAERPEDIAGWLAADDGVTILLRGDGHNGRKTLLSMGARLARLPVLHIDAALMRDEARWTEANMLAALADAVLIVEIRAGDSDRILIPAAPVETRWLALVAPNSTSLDHAARSHPLAAISVPRPCEEARRAHWIAGGLAPEGAPPSDRLLTSGHIRAAARSMAIAGDAAPDEAIRRTLATMRDPRLESAAQRIDITSDLEDLFLEDAEREELAFVAQRCRLREDLGRCGNVGVKALLSGPSGTGKTLAAKHLARELDRPLYRIDLAATVDKYIGETEKSLERTLSAAEELDVVLLLDEGDALLAKRTEVGNSTDRYANQKTNYLLQRLETFRGIIVITTNDGEKIDKAFRRRMDAIIAFRQPDQLRRLQILTCQLGDHVVAEGLLDEIACRCDFTGGQIHNVALHARMLAIGEKQPLANAHLVKAVQREYRKAGDHCPLRPALAEAS